MDKQQTVATKPLSLAAINRDLNAAQKRAAKRERKRGWLQDSEWAEGDEYELADEKEKNDGSFHARN